MSPLMSRDKFHHLSYIFMAVIIMVIYRLYGKIFGNLSFGSLELVYFKKREKTLPSYRLLLAAVMWWPWWSCGVA